MKERINIKELFEKYRKSITPEMLNWSDGNIEDYIIEESYDCAVVEFLTHIEDITNEFGIEDWDSFIDKDYLYGDEEVEIVVYKRISDNKLFRTYFCYSSGTFDEEMIEVKKKTVKKIIYE